jgi:hypothetical protein
VPCTCDRRGASGKRSRCVYDWLIVLSSTPRERVVSRPRSAYLFGFLYARAKYRRVIVAAINCCGARARVSASRESERCSVASYETRGRSLSLSLSLSHSSFINFSSRAFAMRNLARRIPALGSGRRDFTSRPRSRALPRNIGTVRNRDDLRPKSSGKNDTMKSTASAAMAAVRDPTKKQGHRLAGDERGPLSRCLFAIQTFFTVTRQPSSKGRIHEAIVVAIGRVRA